MAPSPARRRQAGACPCPPRIASPLHALHSLDVPACPQHTPATAVAHLLRRSSGCLTFACLPLNPCPTRPSGSCGRNGRRSHTFTRTFVTDSLSSTVYASSKAAVESLTSIMARELTAFGITVNVIGPTPIDTDLTRAVPADKMQRLLQRQAIARYGRFEDVANVVDFFLSDRSDFITGQRIFLGGV
ncbi:MAG TPA: SDR family oxidoreductase [Burkholderiaceae bacterium]|nr:SDR family oxidoreductase [Burkholderiaceae bacterium]